MSDGILVEEAVAGRLVDTDEVDRAGEIRHVQRVKVAHGPDGQAADVSSASPLPVDDDQSQQILGVIRDLLGGTLTVDVTGNPAQTADVAAVRDRLPLTGAASEATLASVLANLVSGITLPPGASTAARQDQAKAVLDAINAKDFSTKAEQVAIREVLNLINGKDFSTHAEQVGIRAVLDQIQANTASAAVDVAQLELTADQVNLNTDAVETILTAINGKDFATQATMAAALGVLQVIQARADVLASEDKLEQLRALVAAAEAARDVDATSMQARLDLLASEAKLEATRALVDEISGKVSTTTKQDALQAVAEAIRDSVFRRTDPLAAGSNNIGYTSPSTSQKVSQGRLNIAGSGRLTLAVAGNVRAAFSNPAGSGKTISIVRLASFSSAMGFASVFLNPTNGVPGTAARPVFNAVAGGGVPALGTLRVDTSTTTPLSGGTDTGLVVGLPPNARVQLDLPPIVLVPGMTLGINIPFAGASDATLSIYWIED